MPNRILREEILDSDSVNSLSWEAEVFYRRLMSVVDDFGLFDGRTTILRGRLYALKPDVRATDISRWLNECELAGLIACYEAEGKPYVLFHKLGSQRAKNPRFPLPPDGLRDSLDASASMCAQTQTNGTYSYSGSRSSSYSSSSGEIREMFDQFWQAYPKKTGNKDAAFDAFSDIAPTHELLAKMIAAVTWFKGTRDWQKDGGQYITAPEKWLKNGRWTEAPEREKSANETLKLRKKAEEEKAKALPPAELAKAMAKLAKGEKP